MDDDDIYGSILSDPKSTSNSNKYSEAYSETTPRNYNQTSHNPQHQHGQGQVSSAPVPPQPSLFISNLTWWTSEDDLRQILGDLSNRIKEVQFLENKPNGKSKGMVIVEFVDVETAEVAKGMLEGKEIYGRNCEVSFARNPPVKPYERPTGMQQRMAPRQSQYPRPDQQYHQPQTQNQRQELSYHHSTNDQYHQSDHGRHVHREDVSYDSRDSRDRRSSRYRDTREHHDTRDRRDSRSRSPDRRSSSKSNHRY